MNRIKPILRIVLMLLIAAQATLASIDSDTTGPDDQAATALGYVIRIISAILNDDPLPNLAVAQ